MTLDTVSAVEAFVDLIYESLDHPESWSGVLNHFSSLTLDYHHLVSTMPPRLLPSDTVPQGDKFIYSQRMLHLEMLIVNDDPVISQLAMHVRRVITLKNILHQSSQQVETGLRMLDVIAKGILIVGLNGELLHINVAASCILKSSQALAVRNNRLWSANAEKNLKLKAAINAMIASVECPSSAGASSYLVIHHENDAIYIHLSPVTHETQKAPWIKRLLSEQYVVMLQITDLNQGLSMNTKQQLVAMYQLSKAELRVATLVAEGLQVQHISEMLQLSSNTVRTQLKAIFKKTKTAKQAELMQLLLRF